MKRFYLDIETLPAGQDRHDALKNIHKTKSKKSKKYQKTFKDLINSTNFDGAFGRIFCIAYAINDEPVKALVGSEKQILEKFWELVKDVNLFIGHNVLDFDLRFIYQRSIILKIKPSRDISFRRYSSDVVFDTMHEWNKWVFGNSCSMDYLAHAMDLPTSKDEMDGSQVYDYYKSGKFEEIVKYCKKDVELNRKIYRRMCFLD